jgi:hypothetical protein
VGQLIERPLHFGYTQYKADNGKLDYTPWIDAFVNPAPNSKAIKLPIIVLADNVSASLSEAVVMAILTLPNGIVIGETTWGATSPETDLDAFNAGGFTINGFLSVETSSCKFKYQRVMRGKDSPRHKDSIQSGGFEEWKGCNT